MDDNTAQSSEQVEMGLEEQAKRSVKDEKDAAGKSKMCAVLWMPGGSVRQITYWYHQPQKTQHPEMKALL